jgi:hypothetical protein
MRKRSAEEKQKQLERFLMNVAEAADAALWEYWREKEAEHRRFATEYAPPVPHSPACASCPYKGQLPCVGYCLKQVQEKKASEPER